MSFSFHILGTSSSGNCSVIESNGTRILLDAGFQGPRLSSSLEKLGIKASEINAVFITHEHSDHCAGLPFLLRQKPNLKVFANRETAQQIKRNLKFQPDWQLFETGTTFEFQGIQVSAIPIPHDACDPVGFAFDFVESKVSTPRRLTWLTDLGHATPTIRHHASLANILVLESNYDEEMLDLSSRPTSLKHRIRGNFGHLSNTQAKELLLNLNQWKTTELYLGHLSKECNRTIIVDEMMNEVRAAKPNLRITVVDPLEENPVSLW